MWWKMSVPSSLILAFAVVLQADLSACFCARSALACIYTQPFNTASCGVLPLSHSPFCQSVYLSFSSDAVAQALQPRISLLPGHEHLLCVPPRPRLNHPSMYCADEDPSDIRGNFTAHCNATMGTVVWLIGGYAVVDRDQFSQQVYGVLVEDSGSNISRFALSMWS